MIVTKYIILWLKKNWKFENLDVLVLWISLETLFKRYSSCSCRGGVDGFTFYTVLLTFIEDQVTLSPMWLAVWIETRAIVCLHCTFYIVTYIWTSIWIVLFTYWPTYEQAFGLAWLGKETIGEGLLFLHEVDGFEPLPYQHLHKLMWCSKMKRRRRICILTKIKTS